MFNAETIQACLYGLIGFRQHNNAAYDRYDSTVAASSSGVYIDSTAHSLFTIENISACAENFANTEISAYAAGTTYAKGDLVLSSGIVYESKVNSNVGNTPDSSPTQWLVTNLLSAYLRRLMNGSINNLFTSVIAEKKLYEVSKTLLTDISLYDGVGNLAKKITKMSRFVGFVITPKYKDTVVNISYAGFQFDTANPDLDLYVYHSSQSDPIATINFNIATPISFSWKQLATVQRLQANSNTYNDHGCFYVGYYEDDLQGRAIWREQSFEGVSCASCSGLNSYLYNQWSRYVAIQPFYVEEAYIEAGRTIFDTEKIIEVNNQNWGLNFKLQVQCDISDFICRSSAIFTDALRKQVIHDLLRDMAFSMRDNQRNEKVGQMAMLSLKGDFSSFRQDFNTYENQLASAIKGLSFDMSGISDVCVPCNAAGSGIEYSSHFS
ncbi:MAG: hypothetical protein JNK14_05805 [Chitinophagaceae bacterium]|nr:hypothetical protein [Chitinophagaceae bacterium]